MDKIIIAADPGASGALCALYLDKGQVERIDFFDFKKEGITGYANVLRMFKKMDVDLDIYIEKVASRPGQGVKSMHTLGIRVGELQGLCAALELGFTYVRPQEWQKAIGVEPKSGKKGIQAVVEKSFPGAELTGPRGGLIDGRSDALGIAMYGLMKEN